MTGHARDHGDRHAEGGPDPIPGLVFGGGPGGGGSGTLTTFSQTGVALGSLGVLGSYTYYTVSSVAKLGLLYRFTVLSSASLDWSVQVWSRPGGTGELMFEAIGIGSLAYSCSWPWIYENQNSPIDTNFHIGIRNNSGASSTFSIAEIRGVILL